VLSVSLSSKEGQGAGKEKKRGKVSDTAPFHAFENLRQFRNANLHFPFLHHAVCDSLSFLTRSCFA
jgi:hypothetical protein